MLALPPNSLIPRALLLGAPIIAVAIAAVVIRNTFFAPGETTQQRAATGRGGPATAVQTAPASVGPISSVFTYAGAIQAGQQVNVVPRSPGIIRDLPVSVGARVRRGDVLAVLDPGALPEQLQQAQAGLLAAEARLAQVYAGARPEDVAAAAAQLNQARARLGGLQQGRPEDIRAALAALEERQAKLDGLEQGGRAESVGQAQAALDSATAKLMVAQRGATLEARQAAADVDRASVTALQTSVANLATSSLADREAAQAGYDAALAQLAAARANQSQAQDPTRALREASDAAVKKAYADLAAAQAQLAGMRAGTTGGACSRQAPTRTSPGTYDSVACDLAIAAQQGTVTSARGAVSSAQAQSAQLVTGGTPASQAQLDAAVEQADANVRSTRAKLDAVGGTVEVQRAQLQSQLIAAQERLKNSEARLAQVLSGGQDEELQQAEAAVREVEQRLALAVTPSTENDLRAQRAQVEQARQQLEKAYLPSSTADIEQQQQVVAQMEAQLQARANPYTAVDLQAALAGLEQARANLAVAETNLAQAIVTAPFDGVVGQRMLNAGAFASNNAPIMVLVGNDSELHITVEEARVGALAPGQSVAFTTAAYPNTKFTGNVVAVAPLGDARAHTFDVTILPDQQDSRLMPGMFAQVQVTAAENTQAVLVPRDAIVQVGGAPTVFVVEAGLAVARQVQTGIVDEKAAEIVSGVVAGEPVVTLGQNGLKDQQPVQVPGGRGETGEGRGQRAGNR